MTLEILHQVHPIFVLSLADLLLALLWVVGAILWFRGAPTKEWCFAASLPTVVSIWVVLECYTTCRFSHKHLHTEKLTLQLKVEMHGHLKFCNTWSITAIWFDIMICIMLWDITWHHMTSHDITQHHMTSPDIAWHHTTSHNITWHRMTSHDITQHFLFFIDTWVCYSEPHTCICTASLLKPQTEKLHWHSGKFKPPSHWLFTLHK